ncbi:hypothetical protein [Aquimarina macrocephali]|uniref:hypothetical protein n=1 Tax=Aquimarina macrocephali TaxID=666563 RepID=UPI003F673EF0
MNSTQSKSKTQNKETASTRVVEETTSPVTTKIKNNIIYYIIAMVCSVAFFVHEFVPKNSQEYKDIVAKHSQAKSKRTEALNILKKSAEGTVAHNNYQKEKNNTDKVWEEYLVIEKEEHFLNFDNFKQFLGEFGWAFGLLIYSIFNIVMVQLRKRNSKTGETILHSTLLFISLYFINWTVLPGDYEKTTYIAFALAMTVLITFSVYLLLKAKTRYVNSLLLNIKDLVGFVFNNTKKESEEEMWDVLKNVRNDR